MKKRSNQTEKPSIGRTTRITLLTCVTVFILLSSLLAAREIRVVILWEERNVDAAVDAVQSSLESAVAFLDPYLAQQVSDGLIANESIFSVRVYDDFGNQIASSAKDKPPPPISDLEIFLGFGKKLHFYRVIPARNGKFGTVEIDASLGNFLNSRLTGWFIWSVLVTATFAVLIGLTFHFLALKPLLQGLQNLHTWLPNLERQAKRPAIPQNLNFKELQQLAEHIDQTHGKISEQRMELAASLRLEKYQAGLNAQQSSILKQVISMSETALLHFDRDDQVTTYSFGEEGKRLLVPLVERKIRDAEEFQKNLEQRPDISTVISLPPDDKKAQIHFELEIVFENRQHHHIAAVDLDDGGFAYLVTDITRSRNLEAARSQLHKMESIGLLTSGVAHEFNNMLAIISSSLELMQAQGLPDHHQPTLVTAMAAGKRAAKTVSQLLRFSRADTFEPKIFEVKNQLKDLRAMLDNILGPEITLMTECPDNMLLNVDPDRFDGAIVNLAINARDAMSGKGYLTFRVKPVGQKEARENQLSADQSYLVVEVTDSGSGIPIELQGRILDPFFSTKPLGKGTGLGLSEVHGFITQIGGTIALRSIVTEGTTFSLYFPVAKGKLPIGVTPANGKRTGEAWQNLRPPTNPIRVLIVDDELAIRQTTARYLKVNGLEADTARGVDEATNLLRAAPNARPYDVLLCDLQLADGSGLDVANYVGTAFSDMFVAIITGNRQGAMNDDLENFLVLEKPMPLSELLEVILTNVGTQRLTQRT